MIWEAAPWGGFKAHSVFFCREIKPPIPPRFTNKRHETKRNKALARKSEKSRRKQARDSSEGPDCVWEDVLSDGTKRTRKKEARCWDGARSVFADGRVAESASSWQLDPKHNLSGWNLPSAHSTSNPPPSSLLPPPELIFSAKPIDY